MKEFIKTNIIPVICSVGFMFMFLGLYKIFDFPKYLIKEKIKIKNEIVILLVILLVSFFISTLLYFFYEKIYGSVTSNIPIDSLVGGFMWSMVYNLKNYKPS